MSYRNRGRYDRRLEALIQAVFPLIALLALVIGGIGHFAQALMALVIIGVVLLLFVGAGYLILHSSMSAPRRHGICLVLLGILMLLVWGALKAPPTWPQISATVRSVTAPPGTVEIDYQYVAAGQAFVLTRTQETRNISETQQAKPTPINLYVDPTNPRQLNDRPVSNWSRVSAEPVARRINPAGDFKAVVAYGEGLFPDTATVAGSIASTWRPGDRISLYRNPITPSELSLQSQPTVGGKHWFEFGFGILAAVGGLWMAIRKPTVDSGPFISAIAPPIVLSPEPPATASGPRFGGTTVREQLNRIDWYQFEKVAARILEHMDWQVTRSGGANPDGGADMIARKSGEVAVVQCKHWHRVLVTPNVVRELLGTKASTAFKAHEAVLFTLSDCTEDARRFAKENGITVFAGDEIASLIQEIGSEKFPELVAPEKKFCPKCDAPMVWRNAAVPFWGCSTFPRCRGKIEVEQ